MKKKGFFLVFFLISMSVFGQKNTPKLQTKAVDFQILEDLILNKINYLRDSFNLNSLVKDEVLRKAALDHSDYQLLIKRITHSQKRRAKKIPYKRVAYYGGTHSTVGENVALNYINKKIKNKNGKFSFNNTHEKLAESIFQSWKNSPGHYANIIHPDYFTSGISFAIDHKTKRIYATHVFGGIPYVGPKGVFLTKDAHGIVKGSDKFCNKIESFRYGSEFFSNYVMNEKGEVYIYFHDLKYFKNTLSGVNDAIAIDIVHRDQLPCNSPNIFHGNEVHDGVMQKPVYYYELYKNNKATRKNYLYSYIGTIPKEIKGNFQLNTMIIKNDKLCSYSYPVSVPSDAIPLFPFIPLFDSSISAKIKPDTIDQDFEFFIPFQRGDVNYDSREFKMLLNRVKGYENYISEITINAYSSIEGSTKQNKYLQEKRLEKIKSKIKLLNLKENLNIKEQSEENWKLFFDQIKKTEFSFLESKTKAEIKEYLKDKNNLISFDSYLRKQRVAKVTISVKDIIDSDRGNNLYDLSLSYHNKLKIKDSKQANSVMSKIIRSYDIQSDFPNDIFFSDSININTSNMITLNNQWAIMLNVPWFSMSEKEAKEINNLIEETRYYIPLQYNFYCAQIKQMYYSKDTLFSSEKLLSDIQSIRKNKHWVKYKNQINEESFNRLIINYHLGALKFYRKNREYEKVEESLLIVKEYFTKANMTVQEAEKMALFFNEYYRFDWSIELLRPYLQADKVNENALFTFVQTASLLRNKFSDEDYLTYMTKAKNANKIRFCKWLNKDFQILRMKNVKEVYCSSCL